MIAKEKELIEKWKVQLNEHISSIGKFLKTVSPVSAEYIENSLERSDPGFNVFTISSDLYYRENFHSDIIQAFLDPNAKHNEGSKYLDLFIKLLNKLDTKTIIDLDDFNNTHVEREKSHIDLLITDDVSKKAIILENKINNAEDQPRQLPRYYDKISGKGYEVVIIVYLTLQEGKEPDRNGWTEEDSNNVDRLLKLLPAYDSKNLNLYNDWIIPAIIQSNNIDSSFILRQYGNLIKYLNINAMDSVSLEKFYNLVKEGSNLETANSMRNMLNELPQYLANKIKDKYQSRCSPFKNIWIFKKTDAVFEGCEIDSYYIKIDIWVHIDRFDVLFGDRAGKDIKENLIEKIEVLSDFHHWNNKNSYMKSFSLTEEEKIYEFLDKILPELAEIKKAKEANN